MSKIQISPNPSGAGTVTLAAPNTASDVTLTLPAASGTVLTTATAGVPIGGPAFSVYQSGGQSISDNTDTKVVFQLEEYDTASCFDNTTNYRFTPNVAGYYVFNAGVTLSPANIGTAIRIFKNGSNVKQLNWNSGTAFGSGSYGSAQLYANGTTDYFELYFIHIQGSSSTTVSSSAYTYFSGCLVRSAT
jgi:hypothetical protein